MNLQQQITSVDQLFGNRNRLYIRNRTEYFDYLEDIVRVLLKIMRKEIHDPQVYSDVLVSLFGWTSALAHSFGDLPIVEMYCKKYPMDGCSYCQSKICRCKLDRLSECRPVEINPLQLNWDIGACMRHNETTYGEANRKRGLQTAVARLIEEILEIKRTLLVDYYEPGLTAEKLKMRVASEFADTLAWIFAVANICGPNLQPINLQSDIEHCYNDVHSTCQRRPCTCPALNWVKVNTVTTTPP